LECSVRTIQRLVKKWEKEGLAAFADDGRSDKGKHRISEEWQKFIVNEYSDGKRTPAQVAVKVKREAQAKGLKDYPSHMTVYRVLDPLIEQKQQSSNIRNIGWRGSRLSLKTRPVLVRISRLSIVIRSGSAIIPAQTFSWWISMVSYWRVLG
jgi:putative transposase